MKIDSATCRKGDTQRSGSEQYIATVTVSSDGESRQGTGQPAPIDMVLHCPACGLQHIDAPEQPTITSFGYAWTNPPHRSHLCHGCGHIWRPADVPTNGVRAVRTRGENDSPIAALKP